MTSRPSRIVSEKARREAAVTTASLPLHEVQRIHRIAEESARRHPSAASTQCLYVIEVERLDPSIAYDFYVGQTAHTPEHRLQQHSGGTPTAGQDFRRGRTRAVRLRYDLMAGLPRFHDRDSAEQAEKLLTEIVTRYIGPAYSR